mgnify:CR=1 FL=1
MADYDGLSPGQVLADASVAEFIKTLGLGIAEAQKALDENSVDQIAEFIEPREGLGGKTLLDLGLSPAFYHYQHADITCSLQLSLRVEKNLSLGLNLSGSYESNQSQSGESSSSESSTESGSSTRTETRQASVEITSASVGALSVGGQQFQLNGSTPAERIENLQDALTGDPSTGIARVLYQMQPSSLTITTDADEEKVQVTSSTVAFLSGGHDSGILRIGTNADTTYTLDDSPATSAATTAQADLAAYANHVKAQIEAQNYSTTLIAPNGVLARTMFETGKHTIPASDRAAVHSLALRLARAMRVLNFPITIEGFADRQRYANRARSDELNRQLGDNRANEIKNLLLANGAPAGLITITPSRGDAAAAEAGDAVGQDNQAFRKAEIKTPGRTHYWLFVHAQDGGPNLNAVDPDKRGDSSADNGFIYLFKPSPLGLSGKKVTIEGVDFPFRGAAGGGHASGSPEAYAKNLADDINANDAAGLKASASANVVTVTKDGDKFQLTLVTAEQRQISLSGTSGISVTREFTRTRSRSATRQNTGNRAVAVGASLDVRYSRQFEMNVTGNSSISARLVSIPAPPQFLETIQEYLNQNG